MSWQSVRFKVYAVVGDVGLDVTDFTMTYELNTVPRCTVGIPVGREVNRLLESNIHRIAGDLTQTVPFELRLSAQQLGRQGGRDKFPKGFVTIFRGYATGSGFRRTMGGAQFVLHAKHWLIDLDYSSSTSATSHPQNPHQFNYQASTYVKGTGTTATWGPFSKTNIMNGEGLADFWEGGLKPALEDLCSQDHMALDRLPQSVGVSTNDTALRALKRINNGVKLSLILAGADSDSIGDAITQTVQMASYRSFASHTLWNQLINQIAPLFMFSLVPRVEDALIVPFVPGLREVYKTVNTTEYAFIDLGAELKRTLQAVGILSGVESDTGYSMHFEEFTGGVGGWYQPENIKEGMVLLKNGPPWLSNPAMGHQYADKSTAAGLSAISTTFSPAEGEEIQIKKPNEVLESVKELINNYAKYVYTYEALTERQGMLSGKVRFDIAPGSTIRIEGPSEKFVPGDELGQPRYATVTRVTIQMNAEAQQAGMSMNLAHIRNEKENEAEGTSIEGPPIWENKWVGDTLIEEYKDQS